MTWGSRPSGQPPQPSDVYGKVRNYGAEAERQNQLRGEIVGVRDVVYLTALSPPITRLRSDGPTPLDGVGEPWHEIRSAAA